MAEEEEADYDVYDLQTLDEVLLPDLVATRERRWTERVLREFREHWWRVEMRRRWEEEQQRHRERREQLGRRARELEAEEVQRLRRVRALWRWHHLLQRLLA